MAQRRMISKAITSSMQFLNMSKSAQALYLHMVAEADDDGVAEGKVIIRMSGCRRRDFEELVSNGFLTVIEPQNNVCWITDWQSFNHTPDERGIPSIYRETLERYLPDRYFPLFKPKTGNKNMKKSGESRVVKNKEEQCSSSTEQNHEQEDNDNNISDDGIPNIQMVQTELQTNYYLKESESGDVAERFIRLNESYGWKRLNSMTWKSLLKDFMNMEKEFTPERIENRRRRAERQAEEERKRQEDEERYWQFDTPFACGQDLVEYIQGGKWTKYDWDNAELLFNYSELGVPEGYTSQNAILTADDIIEMWKTGLIRNDIQCGITEVFSPWDIERCQNEELIAKIRKIQDMENEKKDKRLHASEPSDYYDYEEQEVELPFS